MAHGWDSYYHNLPPLSSDPSTLRRTSESEGSLSQHIENFIGNHDFPVAVASHEAPATNSNFNTNYYSNPNIENPSSDCLYQRYCKDTEWQADGEQTGKDYLPRCGNTDIPDFGTDGLSSSGSFPSSFANDLQELKQDCGMLSTSFLEDYSDVSSCSESDVSETRPSCKFMASNSVPKPKTDYSTKNSSSEWLFSDTGNMMLAAENQCTDVSETNVILHGTSNVSAGQNMVECSQDKTQSSDKNVKSCAGHNQSSTTSNKMTTTGSDTVADRNDYGGGPGMTGKEDAETDLNPGKNSSISISGHKNLAGERTEKYPDGNEKEPTAPTTPIIMATVDNEQCHSDEKVLRQEMKESSDQENEGFDNLNSTDGQDRNTREDLQDKSEDLQRERKESVSFENDEEKSPNSNSNVGQNENEETDCQDKELLSNISQSSNPKKDGRRKCTSTAKRNSQDVDSCLKLPEHQSDESVVQDAICLSAAVTSDGHISNASDKNEQSVASHSESCLQTKSSSTDMNPCLEKEWTSAADKTNTTSSPDPDGNDPDVTDSLHIVTSDKDKQDLSSQGESCLQPIRPSTDMNSCLEEERTSLSEKKTTTSSTEPVCTDPLVSGSNKEQNVTDGLESSSQSNPSSPNINPCQEKERTNPAENTNATSSSDQPHPLVTSPVALQPGSVTGDVAENTRESFEELDTSAEEPSALGMLYGEPLSREDSSCDADETNIDTNHCKDISLARPDSNTLGFSEGQAPQLKSSQQMTKCLQPVVILKTSESVNGRSGSYQCAECQHTTHNVDHLIEHHHRCHIVHNFQFCKNCNLYLIRNEQAEKHVCYISKESPQLSSDSSLLMKIKRRGGHKCMKCGLIFSKVLQYIKHMRAHTGQTPFKCNACGSYFAQPGCLQRHQRIPGRCKQAKLPVSNSDPNIKETETLPETPPQEDLVHNKPYPNLPKCYIKLVDISKTHQCRFCGKYYLTEAKAKKHFYNIHKGKTLVVSSSQSTTKCNSEETKKLQNETTGKYKCPLCPRLFKYSYNRARHLRDCVKISIYGGKEKISGKYRCPLCHVSFTLPSNRYRHIKAFCLRDCLNRLTKERAKSKKKVEQKKETNKGQDKEIEQKIQSKKNEQKKESKEVEQKKEATPALTAPNIVRRYKCSLCPAVFCHASGKYRHMKKHELFKLTGKVFKYRNSAFSTLSNPTSLSSTKTGESTSKTGESSTKTGDGTDTSKLTEANNSFVLSCRFCERGFSTPQSLQKHERNHKGERPYRCPECGKGFKKRAYLIGHKSIHQKRIQCTVCRKILPTIGELIQHRSTHLKRGMLQCPDCHLQFQYPAHLLRHLEGHKRRENKAKQLEERPPLKPQQPLESVKEHSDPKQLQCSLCKEVFNDAQILRKHCLTHITGSSTYQCPFCKRDFSHRRYLLRHMIMHTGDKPFSCTNCGKQFYRDLYLKLHSEKCLPAQTSDVVTMESKIELDTKPQGPHRCSYCPRRFFKKMRLKNHLQGHKTKSLLLCSKCGQYFGIQKFKQHQSNCGVTTELSSGLSSPNGNVCKSSSPTSHAPVMPSKSNTTKMLPFKCSHCTQRFRYRSLLLRHIVSHTGVQPYACMHCGNRYGSQTMCLQHEAFCDGVNKEGQSKVKGDASTQLPKTATLKEAAQKPQAEGEADYKCKFCTKTFMKSRSLRRHILTHNEVKPYRCRACDNCFSRYDHLKVHQARCKGKKTRLEIRIPKISLEDVGRGWQNKFGLEPAEKQETFKCEVCSRSFPTQSKLSRHVTMFHTTKLFKCTNCGSSFSHEKTLKKHKKMRKCRKRSNGTNASLPPETNPPTESVTDSQKRKRKRILLQVQPYFNKKHKYVCSYCPRAFGNSWQLGVHTRLHTGERPYACDYCGQRFIRKDYMQRHASKCTEKSSTSTPRSSKSTVSQSLQPTSKSPPKGFSCAYCSSRFLLFSQLQEHFLNAHQLETKVPPVPTAPLQHHLSNIPNIKKEPLDESGDKQLSNGANLTCKLDTSLESEAPKKFSCSECDMSFTNKAGLTGHLRVHAVGFPFNCKTCQRGFWNKSLLRNHNRKCRFGRISERTSSQQLEVPLKAEIDLVLNDPVLVFNDASKSTGTGVLQTSFSCKDDSMDGSSQNSVGNQVQSSSSKEKKVVQYQCSECDQSFTDGLLLISHLEDHGREEQAKKRNACIKCGQVFSSQGALEKHMRMHEINKKFPCPNCPKVLDTMSELEIHRTCHDPNRPFVCKLCDHRFWTRPSLCNHYRIEHLDDVYSCRFCNKAYAVKKSLVRHYRKWHQKEQKDRGRTIQDKSSAEQSSSQVSTTGESDEDQNNGSEDSDSDSAPYFPCHVCGKTFPTSESLEDHQRCHLGEKPHECAECGKCFFQASQLQQHQRMHKSEFQCQACGRGFVSLFALRKHKHTHGKSRPYRCSKCDLSFTGPSQLAEHMSTHREENFPCDICNRMFLSKSSRAEHRKSHSKSDAPSVSREEHKKSASPSESSLVSPKELKYRCGVCGERFRDPEELSEHGCNAAKERSYSCSDCDKHFLHASHLKKHRTTHHLSWSNCEYPCDQCNRSFSSSERYLSHLKSHVDTAAETKNTEDKDGAVSRRFICPVCHQCFTSATELIHHFPTHPDGTFECKICKKTFPSGSKLEEHERCHVTSATEFECIVCECGQSFSGRGAFHQHHCSHQQHAAMEADNSNPPVKTPPPSYYEAAREEEEVDVTGEDGYNCPVCSMQFSSKSGLLEHQNKEHRHEKPFKCGLCGKVFARRRYLREHERRHRQKTTAQSAENTFKCTQCHTELNTAQELSLHMRLHAEKEAGEFRCDMCYKSFSQWSHLKQHQESHVGQIVYECTECDKAFAFPHLLEEHQQTHAGSSQ
ncbi:zinc finger protein 1035 [Plectropomus leopardus]|uniref:zinc finger protein 1035 n=1 Tax=Plectropomus leopardus TaxID=160734 RepID=UPI001C4D30CE|nr:zinc finger protein 1035 [Plectropomus leopardus]XP_042346435.1 zinc finger protein 1035 [Plectropomus leopardus]